MASVHKFWYFLLVIHSFSLIDFYFWTKLYKQDLKKVNVQASSQVLHMVSFVNCVKPMPLAYQNQKLHLVFASLSKFLTTRPHLIDIPFYSLTYFSMQELVLLLCQEILRDCHWVKRKINLEFEPLQHQMSSLKIVLFQRKIYQVNVI